MRLQSIPDIWGGIARQIISNFGFLYTLILPLIFSFCALTLMLIIGNPLIDWLRNKRWKKGTTVDETWAVREDTPDSHLVKQGTPSMGGIGIAIACVLAYAAMFIIIVAAAVKSSTPFSYDAVAITALLVLPSTFLAHGVLGFADDWSKASGRGGLRARAKLFFQVLFAFLFVFFMLFAWSRSTGSGLLMPQNMAGAIPGQINFSFWEFGASGWCICILLLVTTSNAVNLTDGIDGLAAGLAVQAGTILFLIGTFYHGNSTTTVGAAGFSALFWAALAGACLGFLNFNKYKARVFMGDTGSLAIGAALGAGAMLQNAVFLLPFIGFIYFVEMFSVIAQVGWFKWTKRKTGEGKRLFRRAPLHHHFELGGWSEWRVVGTFWAINLFTSAIGLFLWHAELLPRWP